VYIILLQTCVNNITAHTEKYMKLHILTEWTQHGSQLCPEQQWFARCHESAYCCPTRSSIQHYSTIRRIHGIQGTVYKPFQISRTSTYYSKLEFYIIPYAGSVSLHVYEHWVPKRKTKPLELSRKTWKPPRSNHAANKFSTVIEHIYLKPMPPTTSSSQVNPLGS